MTITERFLKYVSFPTTSDETTGTAPSTPEQKVLASYLVDELRAIGLSDARLDDCGYVYASLPASEGMEEIPALGLIAHMDTSPDVSGKDIKPSIISYKGGDIHLGSAVIAADGLESYIGRDLIVTDGSTLLGADDKAGIAEIVTTVEYLLSHPEIKHRAVAVCFTPDEEIGCGTDHFDFAAFPARIAYTVDGGELGEIEYENFNAASASIEIHGVNIHPGSAKNRMKNAALLAAEFISMMPAAETPAHTEGYEGFYHINDIAGNESLATVRMIIRDHDRAKFEARKSFVSNLCTYLNTVHGEGTFTFTLRDSYYNMKEKLLPHMELIDNAIAAMEDAGITPKIVPISGGTDGARLSYEGIPCPNLSTGGVNFHSIHEFIPVDALEKMVEVLTTLVKC
ncbi:MAG: peptidase T [Clostridia bacterium]|nr:peptidase T [Clostridia bacterium]